MKKLLLYLLLAPSLLFGQVIDGTINNEATTIKNETNFGQNTAIRVGTALLDINSGKQSRVENWFTSGTNNYTITIGWLTSYRSGLHIELFFTVSNTGPVTLNINGFGAKNVYKSGGTSLSSGDINAGQPFELVYDGIAFQISGSGGGFSVRNANNGQHLSGDTSKLGGNLIENTSISGPHNFDVGIGSSPAFNYGNNLTLHSKHDSLANSTTIQSYGPIGQNSQAFFLATPTQVQTKILNIGKGEFSVYTDITSGSGVKRFAADSVGNIYILPNGTTGSNGQVLQTDGTGKVSWGTLVSGDTLLASLSDVNISSPANTQLLQYQTSDSKWHNVNIPTWNQNTTGSAATLTTPRNIQGVAFDGSANINPINGTGFVKATGTTLSYDNSTYLTGNQTVTLSGDVSGSGATSISTTVAKINGTSLAGLATGILKNTTSTGVPSIAIAGDFPTLNQNTTGSAATLTTPRAINGTNFDGSAAITVTAAAGTLTGSTLNSTVTGSSLTLLGSQAQALNMNSHLINNVTDPVSSQDAATKAYVDQAVSGLDVKPDVAYVSLSALPANTYNNGSSGVGATLTGNSNGPLIIDGVTLVIGQAGERVLIAAESTSANNGWYTITQVGVIAVSPYILTRATESDQASEIGAGYLTGVVAPNTVTPGTNNGKLYISVAADPFTVGTTAITFSQVGSTYAAGSGLTLSGNTFSITAPVSVANGGTNTTSAGITAFNNITGYTASGATGTTSTNIVFSTSPTLITPNLGTPSTLVATNITGTASGLTAGNVTTNANLTGPITSIGNATSIASQTGTGTKFVVDTSPTLVTPTLGVASGTSLALSSFLNEAKGADIASASTTDIGAATGNYIDVTGTTSITNLGTVQAGTRRIVRFTGALTLTYNATSLILPGAANITTTAGDVAEFVSLGSGNWRCTNYTYTTVLNYPLTNVGDLFIGGTVTSGVAAPTRLAVGTSGQIVTSDGTNPTYANNLGGWTVLRVAGSDATTTGQSLVDITGLVSASLTNATMYEIEAVLQITTTAVTTGQEFGIATGGSGTASVVNAILTGTTTSAAAGSETINTAATATTAYNTTASATGTIFIRGFVTTRGSGTATISLQHLKVTSGTSTIKIGSVFKYRLVQ